MRNLLAVLLATVGLFGATFGLFGLSVAATVAGVHLAVVAWLLLVDWTELT